VAESRETRCRYCQEVFPEELLRRHGGFCCAEHAGAYQEAEAGEDQKKRAEGGCLWCGASLPLLARLKGERFCSAAHEQQYYRRQAEGILERVKRYRRQGGGSRMRSESAKVTIRPSKQRASEPAPQDQLPAPRLDLRWKESVFATLPLAPEPLWKHEGSIPKTGRLPGHAYWREGLGGSRRVAAPSWHECEPASASLPEPVVRLLEGRPARGRLALKPLRDYHASHGAHAMTDLGRSASWLRPEAVVTPPRWIALPPAFREGQSFMPERGYAARMENLRRAAPTAASGESFWQERETPAGRAVQASGFVLIPPAPFAPKLFAPAIPRLSKTAPPAASPLPGWREAEARPKTLDAVITLETAFFAAAGPNGSTGLPKSRALLPGTLQSTAWPAAETRPATAAESGCGAQRWVEIRPRESGETPVWQGPALWLFPPAPLVQPQQPVSRGGAALAALPPVAGYVQIRREAPELWRQARVDGTLPAPPALGILTGARPWQPSRLGGSLPQALAPARVEMQPASTSAMACWAGFGKMAEVRQPQVGFFPQRSNLLPHPQPAARFTLEHRDQVQGSGSFAPPADGDWIPARGVPQPPAWPPAGSPLEAERGFWPSSGFAVLPLDCLLQNAAQAQEQAYVWSPGLGFPAWFQHAETKMPARMPFHLAAVARTSDAGLPAAPQCLWTLTAIQGVVSGPGMALGAAAVSGRWEPAPTGFIPAMLQKAAAGGRQVTGPEWSAVGFTAPGVAPPDFSRPAWTPGFCRQFVIEGGTAAELARKPPLAPWRAERLRLPHLVCRFPRPGLSSSIGRGGAGASVFPMPGV
jgi:hypothetical protein